MLMDIPDSWLRLVGDELHKPYFAKLEQFVDAERKAYTAAYIGRDTSMWRLQILHDGRTVADWANPNLTTIHGGWTLRRAGQVIGGLGVSGSGDEDRDEQLALKGAEAAAQLAVGEWRKKRDPRPIRDRSAVRA